MEALSSTYERLSSGLRINQASDDVAGLILAQSLNADAKIYAAAVRNLNDGISAVNVADAALQELSEIVVRQQELAEQSASGVYTDEQRAALSSEFDALSDEYERIIASTEYNGLPLIDVVQRPTLLLQAGPRAGDQISAQLPAGILSSGAPVGLGTFALSSTHLSQDGAPPQASRTYSVFADVSGDNIADMVVSGQVTVALGRTMGYTGV